MLQRAGESLRIEAELLIDRATALKRLGRALDERAEAEEELAKAREFVGERVKVSRGRTAA